ncbi:MAG: DivIVA domain-containing protein [Sporichthyaceae bacterium]
MFYVMVILVGVVVFGITAVAAGAGGTLADANGDQQRLVLPPGAMSPADLASVRFAVVLRGYRMDQVDALLDRLGAELADRDARIATLAAGFPRPVARKAAPQMWPEHEPEF